MTLGRGASKFNTTDVMDEARTEDPVVEACEVPTMLGGASEGTLLLGTGPGLRAPIQEGSGQSGHSDDSNKSAPEAETAHTRIGTLPHSCESLRVEDCGAKAESALGFGLSESENQTTTEAERRMRRHILRDARKRIERIEPQQALQEAARIRRERLIEALHAQAVGLGHVGGKEQKCSVDAVAEAARRAEVEERIREAERLVAEEEERATVQRARAPSLLDGKSQPAGGHNWGVQREADAERLGQETPEFVDPSDEIRILRVSRLRDDVGGIVSTGAGS